jgi:hypothetical protein
MPIPVQLHNSLVPVRVRYVPVQLCRTTTTTRVLYTSTTTVPVPIILGKLYSVQPYSRTRTLNLKRSQKVTKTTVFVCWNIFFKKSIWNRFAAGTRLERHTCTRTGISASTGSAQLLKTHFHPSGVCMGWDRGECMYSHANPKIDFRWPRQ